MRDTFYVSANLVDRYLCKLKHKNKHNLQLIGITALWIAAKNEEIYPPKLQCFVKVCDGAFDS
jgi:hypothetical protein